MQKFYKIATRIGHIEMHDVQWCWFAVALLSIHYPQHRVPR